MSSIPDRFRSEADLVAKYLYPKLDEASRILGMDNVIDLHVNPNNMIGIPDIIAEKGGKGLYVVEAKYKKKVGRIERDIEPRDPDVIRQAVGYAAGNGYPWYATANAKRLILFQMIPGKRPEECIVATFEYQTYPRWYEEFLRYILGIVSAKLKPIGEILVETLLEAYRDLYPEFLDSLQQKVQVDDNFRTEYVVWLESQGLSHNDGTDRTIASQTTYLQLNKLLFYQVIRQIYPDKLHPLEVKEEEDIAERLQQYYEDIQEIDYQPIYQTDTISQIPFTKRAKERMRTLLDTLNSFDYSVIERDFLGSIYEKLIPAEERKRLGQFYTPVQVADMIISLTVNRKDDLILDPACGSGTFLVRTYQKLSDLAGFHHSRESQGGFDELFHKQLLEKIYGVDINQFPAHLSVINLAVQNARSKIDKVNVIVNDFFNIKSGQATLSGFDSMDTEGKPTLINIPPAFDVIVANPPYIRQELLGEREKKKIRDLIESEFRRRIFVGNPGKKPGSNAVVLDKQSDIYIYFYIHGVSILKNGGYLGFISSNKWLEVQYGEPFQQFLLNTCDIKYIIEFDRAVFPDAEVNTEVTILEKADGIDKHSERASNKVKFVHLNKALPISEMIARIKKEEDVDDEFLRINTIRQGDLKVGKWSIFLRASPVYFQIAQNKKLAPLGELTQIARGHTTGYDPYFLLDKEKAKEQWKIESKYLKPCAPAGNALKGITIEPKDITDYFLIVREPKDNLRGTNVLKYIQYGEKLQAEASKRRKEAVKLTEVESIKVRQLWYELADLPEPSILFPMWFRYKYRPLVNYARAQARDFYYYIVTKEEEKEVFGALLYSTLTQFLLEHAGRQYSGMLHTKVYELKQLPMLNPVHLTKPQKEKLKKLFLRLNDLMVQISEAKEKLKDSQATTAKHKGLFEDQAKNHLHKVNEASESILAQIDEILYDTLELPKKMRPMIASGLKHLREQRRKATRGIRVEVQDE